MIRIVHPIPHSVQLCVGKNPPEEPMCELECEFITVSHQDSWKVIATFAMAIGLIAYGMKVEAIKHIRSEFGINLRSAKLLVDNIQHHSDTGNFINDLRIHFGYSPIN